MNTVNNNGGSKKCLRKLTLRLRGLQGRCGSTLAETIYRGYGETEAVMDVGFIMVTGV